MKELTKGQARRFILAKQGLLGSWRFSGKEGALSYIRQAGCIQFDPIDVCGRNAELTLQSRVRGFRKQDLYELLYRDHLLLDHTDKELSLIPVEDWPYLSRWRGTAVKNLRDFPDLEPYMQQAMDYIQEHGPVSAAELPISGTVRWNSAIHWSGSWKGEANAARSALEQLYAQGALVFHHKEGARKYYDLASRWIPPEILSAADPCPELIDHIKWGICRRIGAMGVLWDRRSDALLGIWGMDAQIRRQAFRELTESGILTPFRMEGQKESFYLLSSDLPLLEQICSGASFSPRCAFIAPLDPLLWDRQMIEAVFGFSYRWEIYTPAEKRKYGYYTLPILYGEKFIGRIETVADRKTGTLLVKKLWHEPGVRQTKKLQSALEAAIRRFAKFNECTAVEAAALDWRGSDGHFLCFGPEQV